jgi:hypothetical protein
MKKSAFCARGSFFPRPFTSARTPSFDTSYRALSRRQLPLAEVTQLLIALELATFADTALDWRSAAEFTLWNVPELQREIAP